MMNINYEGIIVIVVFLWIGFVAAISFMEAWLKFQAPGITVPLGLGIGTIVFAALNKVEWFFACMIAVLILLNLAALFQARDLLYISGFIILLMQTFWLLPALGRRAAKVIKGEKLAPSHLHLYFVAMEMIKVASLFLFGFSLLKK